MSNILKNCYIIIFILASLLSSNFTFARPGATKPPANTRPPQKYNSAGGISHGSPSLTIKNPLSEWTIPGLVSAPLIINREDLIRKPSLTFAIAQIAKENNNEQVRPHHFSLGIDGEKGLIISDSLFIKEHTERRPIHDFKKLLKIATSTGNIGFKEPQSISISANVKLFANLFLEGANSPAKAFKEELLKTTNPIGVATLIEEWASTIKSKRIFISGTKNDTQQAMRLRDQYESQGYTVFFYMVCHPLCHERTVGAFFATSGSAIHIHSPSSGNSDFLHVEVATALAIDGKRPFPSLTNKFSLLVVDPEEVMYAIESKKQIRALLVDCDKPYSRTKNCLVGLNQ